MTKVLIIYPSVSHQSQEVVIEELVSFSAKL
jgi:hypothetical protein